MIPIFRPDVSQEEIDAVVEVLKSGYWSSGRGGPKVRELEEKFSRYVGAPCVAVNSGTAALNIAVSLLESSARSRHVLVPSLTFVATVHAVWLNGLNPYFIDVDEESLCIDLDDLESAKSRLQPQGVVAVDFAGRRCRVEAGESWVVDDAAHSLGLKNLEADITCFSLDQIKTIHTPGGGMLCLKDKSMVEEAVSLRWHGIDVAGRRGAAYDVVGFGGNSYMSEVSAALALAQLPKVEQWVEKRRETARTYGEEFSKLPWLKTPSPSKDHVYWTYVVRVKKRDRFIKHMAKCGVETTINYARGVHQMSCYTADCCRKLPVTERVANEVVSLPIFPTMAEEEVEQVIEAVNYFKP